MAELKTPVREVQPLELKIELNFTTADLHAAFAAQADPDEDLFYDTFSEAWDAASISKKLATLSRVAELMEGAAAAIQLGLGDPVPK